MSRRPAPRTVLHLCCFAALLCLASAAPLGAVIYQLDVHVTWDETHPAGLPSDSHLSFLEVWTTNAGNGFWHLGEPASEGTALMAVSGCIDFDLVPSGLCNTWGYTHALDTEFATAQAAGDAGFELAFEVLSGSGDMHSLLFDVAEDLPFVTAASMLGPTPDWFTGFSEVNLRPGGVWVTNLTIDMDVYDGGVLSSNEFVFNPNGPASPPGTPIQRLDVAHPVGPGGLLGSAPVGYFTLTLVPEPGSGSLLLLGLALAGVRLVRRAAVRPQ